MHPKIWDDEKPELPKEGLLILRVIGKSIGTLSIFCPAETTSTNTLTLTSYWPTKRGVPKTLIQPYWLFWGL